MRIHARKTHPANHAPRQIPHVFECARCDAIELRQSPRLPEGWDVEYIDDEAIAHCPDCTLDLMAGAVQ
ncbi:hypothetical protein [Novosphingobium sp. 9]|uniref:hypothetical protein n=1 Tax=Novosphingobium sp. 9 TaxID=2025349 RepID=UPI0021B5C492|nr:hypothetical protein [Novosphingobium sp. 9]